MNFRTILPVFLIAALLSGCGNSLEHEKSTARLVIYTAITMRDPIHEIAAQFEKMKSCRIAGVSPQVSGQGALQS